MKIKHLLAALLLVSSFATQATAHTRTDKIRHWDIPRSAFLDSHDDGPNSPTNPGAGGMTMWNGRSASEYGGS
jgi:hypothetical protein